MVHVDPDPEIGSPTHSAGRTEHPASQIDLEGTGGGSEPTEDSARSFQEPPRSASPPTLPGPTLARPSTGPRRAQGRRSPAMPREPLSTKDLRLIRGRSLIKVPPLIKDPSSTKRPRSTKDPLTKGLRSTRSMRPALRSVVALAIRWTWIRPATASAEGITEPVQTLRPGDAAGSSLDPNGEQVTWNEPALPMALPAGVPVDYSERRDSTDEGSRRKTSSGRSQTHPGPASSPEPPRARTPGETGEPEQRPGATGTRRGVRS